MLANPEYPMPSARRDLGRMSITYKLELDSSPDQNTPWAQEPENHLV